MKQPYINVISNRDNANEYAYWAVRVPFLPAMAGEDFAGDSKDRVEEVQRRFIRLVYDLLQSPEKGATFELRFLSLPSSTLGKGNEITIIFIGRVLGPLNSGREAALKLWHRFINVFPLEEPLAYPIVPIATDDMDKITAEREMEKCLEPFSYKSLSREHVGELRRYEELLTQDESESGEGTPSQENSDNRYLVHLFEPNTDTTPMARFFATLADPKPAGSYVVVVSMRPRPLSRKEVTTLSRNRTRMKEALDREAAPTGEAQLMRAQQGLYFYTRLLNERHVLAQVRITIVGNGITPTGVAAALGSELLTNVTNPFPAHWNWVQPNEEDLHLALQNVRHIGQARWGSTLSPADFPDLPFLFTASEAHGAFRLPVPPRSGYLPGIPVRCEPFFSSITETDDCASTSFNKVDLGIIYHRGVATGEVYGINTVDLNRHMLVAGATGSGESMTIKHLLVKLWEKKIPWLVIYPVNKPDYRELRGVRSLKDDLMLFTLGDSVSPFMFNPLDVPEHVPLWTHISRILRVFVAAYDLFEPLPMIYRKALQTAYERRGWRVDTEQGNPRRECPTMSDVYKAIEDVTESYSYGKDTQATIRQASVIRIADLLGLAGSWIDTRQGIPLSDLLNAPVILELGHIGSPADTNLLMGLILNSLVGYLEGHPRPSDHLHITVIEEAHRLMMRQETSFGSGNAMRVAAGEDMSNLLAEVRGYGEGLILAEQIPDLLVRGAVANTYVKLFHWLDDPESAQLAERVLNLSPEQNKALRSMMPGFALIRGLEGQPLQVKVPDFRYPAEEFDPTLGRAVDDDSIRLWMQTRYPRAEFAEPDQPGKLLATVGIKETSQSSATALGQVLRAAPFAVCAFCRPLHSTGKCLKRQISYHLIEKNVAASDIRQMVEEAWDAETVKAQEVLRDLQLRLPISNTVTSERYDIVYCIMAQLVVEARRHGELKGSRLECALGLLENFESATR